MRTDLGTERRAWWWRALQAVARAVPAAFALMLVLVAAPDARAVTLSPGDILVSDLGAFGDAGGVIRVDPATGAQATVSSGGLFAQNVGLALEADGDIVVADMSASFGAVIRIDPATGAQATVSSGGSFEDPVGVAVEADGDILVSDSTAFGDAGGVIRVDPVTGAQATVSSGGSFVEPIGVALEADGDILVADLSAFGGPGGVIRVDPVTGAQATVSSGGLFSTPVGVAVEADGDILVADSSALGGAGAVIRVDPVTGAQATVSSGGLFAQPFGVALEADGVIVVSDPDAFARAGGVIRVDPVTGAQASVSSGGSFARPYALAVVPSPANRSPVAGDDAYSTAEDTPLAVAAPGVLANDSDPDGDMLGAVRVFGPAHGALTLNTDGSFRYVPAAGFNGADSFAYRVSDGSAGSSAATVTLTVHPAGPPAPPPPSATALMRLRAPSLSVFGRTGGRARCRMRTGRIRSCTVRLLGGRRVLARGRAARSATGARGLTVTLELTGFGRALLARRLGGVRTRIRARGATSGGVRQATTHTRALLRRERFRTPAGAWQPGRADMTPRGRTFVRGLRGKLIAVAGVRCDGHDADVRGATVASSRLSRARAAAMCDALRQLGVRARPRLAGHGDSQPIASNTSNLGRAKNRRVEVTITHPSRRP